MKIFSTLFLKPSRLLLSISLFAVFFKCFAQQDQVTISNIPDWVEIIAPSYMENDSTMEGSAGFHYLLVDRQDDLEKDQIFRHYAVHILNNEGVQEMSDLSFGFDPEFQTLDFHKIQITRDGAKINKLKKKEIKVVQRESNMERKLYDGRLTAIVNLSDIRPGDILEYSYSISGSNPIYNGRKDDRIYMGYSLPIEHYYYRLIFSENRNLDFKYQNGAPEPEKFFLNGDMVYTWDIEKLSAIYTDTNVPSWYEPYPYIYFSEYGSWENVADQYRDLYLLPEQEKNELEEKAEEAGLNQLGDGYLLEAIRFVQDEIRYLGFENGIQSHKPMSPVKVIDLRYGDCKAKSFLLSELLGIRGIEASPVLVHSFNGHSIENDLPTPNAFNHCVVRYKQNGQYHYVDPTMSNQGGDLAHNYFPNYQKGLVLAAGEKSLVDLPDGQHSSTKVTESFEVEEIGKGAVLNVYTVYKGKEADAQRANFASVNLESIQKSYVDFYSTLYPSIYLLEDIRTDDKREGENEFIVEEKYRIDSFWMPSESKKEMIYCEFYPLSIEPYISVKKSPERTMPYYLNYPVDFTHILLINLPEKWNADDEDMSIADESFTYDHEVKNTGSTIRISHRYQTHRNFIEADKVASFISKHDEILSNLSYVLTYDSSLVFSEGDFKFSWLAGFVTLLTLLVGTYFAIKIYFNYDVQVPYSPEGSLNIGGWLILIGIGIVFTPFMVIYDLFSSPEYFNSHIWGALFHLDSGARELLTGLVMFFELIYNLLYLVFVILVIVLFFKRRSILPKSIIIMYATVLLFTTVDTVLALQLNPSVFTEAEKDEFYIEILRSAVRAAIWIPYFMFSDRVKQTFVVQYATPAEENGQD